MCLTCHDLPGLTLFGTFAPPGLTRSRTSAAFPSGCGPRGCWPSWWMRRTRASGDVGGSRAALERRGAALWNRLGHQVLTRCMGRLKGGGSQVIWRLKGFIYAIHTPTPTPTPTLNMYTLWAYWTECRTCLEKQHSYLSKTNSFGRPFPAMRFGLGEEFGRYNECSCFLLQHLVLESHRE